MTQIEWNSKFITSDKTVSDGLTHMLLKGILIDNTANKNNWQVEPEDFKMLAADFVGKQVRCDHGEHVGNVLGRVISTEVDSGHSEAKSDWDIANVNPHIHYIAEIASKDNDLIVPIAMGFVDYVSPAVDATKLLCSVCKTEMRDKHTKNCDCLDSVLLLKNLSARELSLVASPAYDKTVAKVYSFAASVDNLLSSPIIGNDKMEIKNLNIGKDMTEDMRIVRLEASVANLIRAFKAAEEEQEEEKKKEELKAEEEMKAEEEEAEKMVPVSKVAEEEEVKPEEEKKEDEKVEKLEKQVAQLVAMMKASLITPETPEDEPAETTHKIPKITNEPVKSEKLKDGFKFPLETAGMKPGKIKASAGRAKGTSTSFTGAVAHDEDVEQIAVDEIFGFAASRGTLPMNADSRIKTIKY